MLGHPPSKPYLHRKPESGRTTTFPIWAPREIREEQRGKHTSIGDSGEDRQLQGRTPDRPHGVHGGECGSLEEADEDTEADEDVDGGAGGQGAGHGHQGGAEDGGHDDSTASEVRGCHSSEHLGRCP